MLQDFKTHLMAGEYRQVLRLIDQSGSKGDRTALNHLAAECRFRLACALLQKGDDKKTADAAVNELTQATALRPDQPVYHYYSGLAFERLGNAKKARAAYRSALEAAPDNERFFRALFLCCLQSGQIQTAIELWRSVESRFPGHWAGALLSAHQGADITSIRQALSTCPYLTLTAAELLGAIMEPTAAEVSWDRILSLLSTTGDSPSDALKMSSVVPVQGVSLRIWALYAAAACLLKKGEAGQAAVLYRELLKEKNFPIAIRPALAGFCRQMGLNAADPLEAVHWFSEALRLAPDSPEDQRNRRRAAWLAGNRYAELGEWQSALELWESCAIGTSALLRNVILAKEKLEHDDVDRYRKQLIEAEERELRSHPSDRLLRERMALDYRALLQSAQGADRADASLPLLKKLHDLTPDDDGVRLQLAVEFMDNRQWDAACRHFAVLSSRHPDDVTTLVYYSISLEELGRLDDALLRMERAFELQPKDDWIRLRLAELLTLKASLPKRRAEEDPLALFSRAMTLAPDCFLAFKGAAVHMWASRAGKTAMDLLRLYESSNPQDLLGAARCAVVCLEYGSKTGAVEFLRLAERRASRQPRRNKEIGELLLDVDIEQAQRFLRKATKSKNTDPCLLTEIGELWAEEGDLEEAGICFRKGLSIDPLYYPALISLAMLEWRLGNEKSALSFLAVAEQAALESNDATAAADARNLKKELLEILSDDEESLSPAEYFRSKM